MAIKIYSNFRLYHILLLLLVSAIFFPTLREGSGVRVDTLLIYLIVPLYILVKGFKLVFYDKKIKQLVLVVMLIPMALFLSFIVRVAYSGEFTFSDSGPLFGFIRFLLFFILAAVAIHSEKDAKLIFTITLIGVGVHSFFALIEYFRVAPLDSMLSNFYNNEGVRLGLRGIGAFYRVHTLAFFLTIGFFLTLGLYKYYNKTIMKVLLIVCLAASIVPFSKISLLILISAIFMHNIFLYKIKGLFLFTMILILMAIAVVFLLPESSYQYLAKSINHLTIILDYIFFDNSIDSKALGSISGRGETFGNVLRALDNSFLFGVGLNSEYGFTGDGLYFSILSHDGFLGFFSLIFFLFYLFYLFYYKLESTYFDRNLKLTALFFLYTIVFGGLVSGVLGGRLLELLPILFISLYVFIDRRYKKYCNTLEK